MADRNNLVLWESRALLCLFLLFGSSLSTAADGSWYYQNIAVGKPSKQIDTIYNAEASRANDGNPSGNWAHDSCSKTASGKDTWWVVDLLEQSLVYAVQMKNRNNEQTHLLKDFYVYVSETNPLPLPPPDGQNLKGELCLFHSGALPASDLRFLPCESHGDDNKALKGRYVYVWKPGSTGQLQMCEVEVLTRYPFRQFTFAIKEGLQFQSQAEEGEPYRVEDVLLGATHVQCSIFCLNLVNATEETMKFDKHTAMCWCFRSNRPFEDSSDALGNVTASHDGFNILERQ